MKWRHQETVLAFIVAANVVQLGARLVISPVVPGVIDAFSVSKSETGLALTGMWAAYALMQFPSGVFGSRFGERRVILAGLLTVGVASLLLSISPTFFLFGAFVFLLGAGGGLFFPAASLLLARLYDNTGMALGTLSAGAAVAGLAAPIASVAISVRYGWRPALLLGAVGVVPVVLLIWWQVPRSASDRHRQTIAEQVRVRPLLEVLIRPSIAYSILIAVIGSFTFQAFVSFFPTFLAEFGGLSIESASLAFSGVFLLSAVTQPVVGRLSDMVGRDVVLAATMTAVATGFSLLLGDLSVPVVVVAVALLGVGFTWFGVVNARVIDNFSEEERTTGFGLVRTVYMLLAALGSVVTGTLADLVGWVAAYGLLVVLLGFGVATLVLNLAFDLEW